MKLIAETERLRLREFAAGDAQFIVELLNSPGWLEFIGDRHIRTEEQAREYLVQGPVKSYQENGFGLSLVETKDGVPVGMCGLIKRPALEHADIGFAFLPQFMGRGYAFEIASATMDYARNVLGMLQVCAITRENNSSSIRLLEKLGFRYDRMLMLPGGKEELMLFMG